MHSESFGIGRLETGPKEICARCLGSWQQSIGDRLC